MHCKNKNIWNKRIIKTMKTIRHNCFETNSSSTHAYTIFAPPKVLAPTAKLIPGQDGTITIDITDFEGENTITDRIAFILSYAYYTNDKPLFNQVVACVNSFCECKLLVTTRIWNPHSKKYDSLVVNEENLLGLCDKDKLRDEFYSFLKTEYEERDFEYIEYEIKRIRSSNEMLKTFIFSNHTAFTKEEFYDG